MRRRGLAPGGLQSGCLRPPLGDLKKSYAVRRDRVVLRLDQGSLWHRADDLFLHFAALDDKQIRDAANAVTSRSLRVVVNVDLHHFKPTRVLARQVVDDRRNRAAWRAPRRPEIY